MTANDMPLIKLTDRLVNAVLHGESQVGNAPDDKDENEARCVGEPGKGSRSIYGYDPPPLRGAAMPGR